MTEISVQKPVPVECREFFEHMASADKRPWFRVAILKWLARSDSER